MKQSIGYTVTINIIIVFLLLTFAFILCSYSYSKAFRANSKIVNAIEKNEGYNQLALTDLNNNLTSLGYEVKDNKTCKKRNNISAYEIKSENRLFKYCIYKYENNGTKNKTKSNLDTVYYGVVTYMNFDFTVLGFKVDIPVYGTTRNIYKLG